MTFDTNPRRDGDENGKSTGWNRRRFLGTAGAAGVAGLAGPAGTVSGQDGPIRIGAVYLLSGLGQSLGAASVAAAELTVKKINESGGILGRDVELIVRDHENSAATANQHFRDLVQRQNVAAMIGLTSSGVTLSTAPTVAQLGVPLTLTDIGTPFITEHDEDTYGDNAQGTNVHFRTNANTAVNTYAMARYANENLDVTRVANIGPDYAYGQQCWEYFKAFSNALGADYEYVASQFPEVGASDMTPQINTVTNANPELVFTSFWGGDAVTFVQQATQQGLFEQATDVFDTLGADPTVFQALGDTMPEGVNYSSWYWHSTYDNENNQNFLEAWTNEYENTDTIGVPSFTGPTAWSALWTYKQAMENAGGTNPDDIISQLEGMEFADDPRGSITIDADSHQAQAPTSIGTTNGDADVPYDGVGLQPSQSIGADRQTLTDLLSQADTNLPPGV